MGISLTELKSKSPTDLVDIARKSNINGVSRMRKQDQIFAILKAEARNGGNITGEGVMETLQDGFGFFAFTDGILSRWTG